MTKDNNQKTIDISQAKCTELAIHSPVQFLRAEPDSKTLTGFDIAAYTGAVVDRWWGKLVIDVTGIEARQQMPIFRNHDHDQIVGYSTGSQADGVFSVQGVFSGATEAAKEVKALALEGFPWQASIGVRPKMILEVGERATMHVNGQEVAGPAEVWLESEVFETSFVPLGADSSTRVAVFSAKEQAQEQPAPAVEQQSRAVQPTTTSIQEQTMDLDQLKKEHPELVVALTAEIVAGLQQDDLTTQNPTLVTAITAQGAQLERDRIADVRAQLIPGHEGLIAQLELDGTSSGAEAAKAIIVAERQVRQQAAQHLDAQANPAVGTGGDASTTGKGSIKREDFNKLSESERREQLSTGITITD